MKQISKLIVGILVSSWLSVPVAVNAALRYVDNTSSCSGDGSSSAPHCSIQDALNAVQAGDTIKIRTGTGVYSETASITGKSGTAANPIIVEPDSGASFVIRNTAAGSFNASIKVKESDYWTFRNLTFDAAGVNPSIVALHVQCETRDCVGIVIENNTFKNWTQRSQDLFGPNVLYVAGCHVDLGCPANTFISATIRNNLFDNNQMYALKLLTTRNTVVANNEVKNQACGKESADGAINWAAVHATYHNDGLVVEDNQFHDFKSFADCPLPLSVWPTVAAYWCDVGGHNTIIRRNKIWNIDQNGADPNNHNQPSRGLFVEAGCDGHTVYNNTIYNIKTAAIENSYHGAPSTAPANVYYNNTIFNIKGWGFFLKEGRATFSNNIVRNAGVAAFCYGCTSGSPSLLQVSSNYNLYDVGATAAQWAGLGDLSLTSWRSQCNCDANSLTGNPLFVNESAANFQLQASSPARGAGEGGVDLGAYAYVGGSIPIAPSNLQVKVLP